MRIADALNTIFPCFSFEFYPPKNEAGLEQLMETIGRLRRYNPTFVSVTYGAGGSSRGRTLELVTRFKAELGIEAMAHLTCVGHSRDELRQVLDALAEAGVENIMALRGDPPKGETQFTPPPDGFAHGSELIAFIKQQYDFCVGGAAYPETHPEAESPERDLHFAREKVRAGADFLTTQMFLDNSDYFAYVDRARLAGIDVPIVPGILPITHADQVARFTGLSGSRMPPLFEEELRQRADDPVGSMDLGVAYTTLQCEELLRCGAPGIHFYTLNRSPATSAILAALQVARPWLRPRQPAPARLAAA